VGAGVDRGQLVIADLSRERDVRQLGRPRAGLADEHERHLSGGAGEGGDALAGIGRSQTAHPHEVLAVGQGILHANGAHLGGRPGVERRRRRLTDDDDSL